MYDEVRINTCIKPVVVKMDQNSAWITMLTMHIAVAF